ncbi:PD-(D/E)XK nuclease family protein [Pseudomonas sp.]|uniref:PDDEXK-like family protein n=1 Tax=Pseudomonas sp. TaxID=306 RepID=UPI0031D0EE4F
METLEQLEALRTSADFTSLIGYTNTFDLFKVMGVSTKELVHSNILAAFMNEHEAHGMGASFRNAYVASLFQNRSSGQSLPKEVLERVEGAKAKVSRELAHIDVLLDFPTLRLVIAIENKIWAADKHKQVARYQQVLCELYPHYESRALVYLTPTGRESPTRDTNSSVPVYYQSYTQLAELLRKHQSSATPPAAQFISQFITHVEKTMSGNTELSQLCWNIFEQHEEAYEHLVKHYENCKARKMAELFDELQERLSRDNLFAEWAARMETRFSPKAEKRHYDLDIRLKNWPDGVWIKIYKHSWFGVFPYFRGADLESLKHRIPTFAQSARPVLDWEDHYFASTNFLVKDDRCVLANGDKASENHLDEALTKVHDCIEEINQALADSE